MGDSGLLGTCVQLLSFFPPTGPAAGAMQLPMAKRWAQNLSTYFYDYEYVSRIQKVKTEKVNRESKPGK